MKTPCAYRNEQGEWVYPQLYYRHGKRIAKKRLIEQINNDPLIQQAIQVAPHVGRLIEEAKKQRCVMGYNVIQLFYNYYKPQICNLVGWESRYKELRTREHYDAVYDAIYDLLPEDETGMYGDGIMPNGAFCPSWQEKYEREYP